MLHVFLLDFFLLKVLPECCGKCAKWNAVNLFDSLRDYQHSTEQQLPDLNATNVLFPLLGGSSTNKQFEFFFLPIFEMSSLLLITRTREESDMAKSLLSGIFTIWPLLLVCLLMSCIAGFVAWVLVSSLKNFRTRGIATPTAYDRSTLALFLLKNTKQ